jgi:hypothetical protein
MHGLLLLAIAGVVIALVESAVANMPDTQIDVSTTTASTTRFYMREDIPENTVLLATPARSDVVPGTNRYYTEYDTLLLYPPPGYKYVIVFSVDSHFHSVRIAKCHAYWGRLYYPDELLIHNNRVYIEWADCIIYLAIYRRNSPYTDAVYIFVLRYDAEVPFEFSAPTKTVQLPLERNTPLVVLPQDVDEDWVTELYRGQHLALYVPALPKPRGNYKYVIVFKPTQYTTAVEVWGCTEFREITNFHIYSGYAYIEWSDCIGYFFIYAEYPAPASTVYVFSVESSRRIPFPVNERELLDSLTTSTATTRLSSRMLLRFVSWTATIALVVSALRKFDIML